MGSIETCVCVDNNKKTFIKAIRFNDKTGNLLQYIGAQPTNYSTWERRDIPDGKELIGLSVGLTDEFISRLAFAVWEPNYSLEEFTLKPKFFPRWNPNLTKSVLFSSNCFQLTNNFPKENDFDDMPL